MSATAEAGTTPKAEAPQPKGPEVVVKGKDIPKSPPKADEKKAAPDPKKPDDAKPDQPKVEDEKPKKPGADVFAAIARKEAKATGMMQQAKTAIDNANALFDAFGLKGATAEQIKAAAARYRDLEQYEKDPFEILDKRRPGWFKDATNRQLGRQVKPTVEEQIAKAKEDAVAETRRELSERDKREAEQQEAAAKQEILDSATEFVQADPQKYELICAEGLESEVGDLILLRFRETGALMSLEDAADAVESFLAERLQKRLATKKAQAMIQPKDPQGEDSARLSDQDPKATGGPKTINSAMRAPVAKSGSGPRKSLDEKWEAIRATRGIR